MNEVSEGRHGDTHGDTRAVKQAHSKPRRPRKTKAPAKVRGVEHRWSPELGWRFRARMKVDGRVITSEWGTRDEAIGERDKMNERRTAAEDVQLTTLVEACQEVLDSVRNREGTWRSYEEHFQTLCAFFGGDTPLVEITSERIREFLHHRRAERVRGKPPSELRLRKNLTALNRVIRLATLTGRFNGANPLERVEKPKQRRKESDYFGLDELVEIFDKIRHTGRDFATIAALTFSGVRRTELAKLTVNMIDRKSGLIRGVDGKTGERSVPISIPLQRALDELAGGRAATDYLIVGGPARGPRKPGGRIRSDLERRVGTIIRANNRCRDLLRPHLKERFHPHALRHSLRTLLADANVPEHIRDAITGHARRTTGGNYEHVSAAAVRAWMAKVLDPLLWLVDETVERPSAAEA